MIRRIVRELFSELVQQVRESRRLYRSTHRDVWPARSNRHDKVFAEVISRVFNWTVPLHQHRICGFHSIAGHHLRTNPRFMWRNAPPLAMRQGWRNCVSIARLHPRGAVNQGAPPRTEMGRRRPGDRAPFRRFTKTRRAALGRRAIVMRAEPPRTRPETRARSSLRAASASAVRPAPAVLPATLLLPADSCGPVLAHGTHAVKYLTGHQSERIDVPRLDRLTGATSTSDFNGWSEFGE